MVNFRQAPEVYAAFRAECLKADIEMDSAAHRRPYRHHPSKEVTRQEKNAYAMAWNEAHREEIRAKAKARYAQKKAASSRQTESGAVENILNTL